MSDANSFQFFVMIGGPFWCVLLLCFLGGSVCKSFTRWRKRDKRRAYRRSVEEKFGSCRGVGMSIPAVFKKEAEK